MRSSHRENLMGRPSVISDYCAVCGAYGTHRHHAVVKGIGGVSRETDARIPLVSLCPSCHELVHARKLHLQWDGGWKWLLTRDAVRDEEAWRLYAEHYSPMKGWRELLEEEKHPIFGRRR